MIRPTRRLRAFVATLTAAVVMALTVAVPLLDQGRGGAPTRISESGTPAGYVDHDHAVCLQYGATAWSPAEGADAPSELFVREDDPVRDAARRTDRAFRSLYHSRAPPSV